jgi:NADPH:quinone reductase
MRAARYTDDGGVTIADLPVPEPGPDDLLVEVHAAALNRGDLLQRSGDYHLPAGVTPVPGVEVAGTVAGWGAAVTGFRLGDRVFGVVEGGGYAEYCLLDRGMANPVPARWGFTTAAATAESWLTATETLLTLGNLRADQRVLVHAGASGVGTVVIQLAAWLGATVYATVGSAGKAAAVRALGAHAAIDRIERDFVPEVRRLTADEGVDLVLDVVGAPWLAGNLAVLRDAGCLVLAGLLGGFDPARVDLREVILRRLQIKGYALRPRPLAEKRAVNQRFRGRWLDLLSRGELPPVVHAEYRLDEVHAAQREMAENRNIGKIVLCVRD